MKPIHTLLAALLVLVLIGGAVVAVQGGDEGGAPPPAPTEPGGVSAVIYARPFVLDQGFQHSWRAERPLVTTGWLLVLEVERDYVTPREMLEPVLYVGDEVAERVNRGWPSGRLVVIAPTLEGADGLPVGVNPRAWFGPPELPERIDAAALVTELARADAAGIQAGTSERFAAARERGGALLQLPDRLPLERLAAELVLELAPGEEELAHSLLVPLSR